MKALKSIGTVIAVLTGALPSLAGEIQVSYLYKLSNFGGVVPFSSPKITIDPIKNEIYVLSGSAVSVFNSAGMEVFRSDYDPEVGVIYDLAVAPQGDIITLTYRNGRLGLTRNNYRFEPQETIELGNLPREYADFHPNQVTCHDGRLILASNERMAIVVTDMGGNFVKGYDLVPLLGEDEKGHAITDMSGLSLDAAGNMLFVLPVAGKACRLSPDGRLDMFGNRGSGPGKFGVPGWVVPDRNGNYLVCDKLRSMVLIFNKELRYVKEFGSTGVRDAYLAGPSVMALDGEGKLYVGQMAARGIHVYRIDNG